MKMRIASSPKIVDCPDCLGSGKGEWRNEVSPTRHSIWLVNDCERCGGRGYIDKEEEE